MRVKFVFNMETIPLAKGLGTLSIIKEMIRNGSIEYYNQLFIENKKEMKPFSYSTYIPNLVISEDQIIGTEFHLTISSPSYEFILNLMNGSRKGQIYSMGKSNLLLKNKMMLPKKTITKEKAIFKTLSPILIESKNGKPLLATDEDFNKEFQYIAQLILKELHDREPLQPIRVLQTMMTKQVMKENLHQKQNKPLYLTANKGFIQLSGSPEDLQALYDSGVSLRRSLGLGLLELVEEVD